MGIIAIIIIVEILLVKFANDNHDNNGNNGVEFKIKWTNSPHFSSLPRSLSC